jgi:phage-related protein
LSLDHLNDKYAAPSVSGIGGAGGTGLASSTGGGAAGGGGLLTNPYIMVPAIAVGLATLPFLAQAAATGITVALGGAFAALDVYGAMHLNKVKAAFADLKTSATEDFKDISRPFGPVMESIFSTAERVLDKLTPTFTGMSKIMAGPFKDFADTFLKSFTQPSVKQSFTDLATAFGDILKALAPQLPGDIRDIAQGVTMIANTIKDNPRAFADFISFLIKTVAGTLMVIADLGKVANYIEAHFLPALHDVAVVFDGVRHDIAHIWDMIYQNTIGTVIRFGHDVETQFSSLKNSVASIWDTIWRNTVTRVANGVADVTGWFRGLPGKILGALSGLGHSLWQEGSYILGQFWDGVKAIGSQVLSWFNNFIGSIVGFFKKLLGIHSPSSVFYDIGKQMMLGLEAGIKAHANLAANAAKSAARGVGDTGARSGSAAVAQAFARSVLPRGWSWPALLSLWNQESGWNAYAVNPSSGAYGIPQSLGHGHPYNLGDYKAQIMWGISYIAGRYGNSQGAWAHEQAFNWYDRGGWLPPGASLAVNTTGRPEAVLGGGPLAEVTALLRELVAVSRQAPARTAAGVTGGINGGARAAARAAYYSARPS